MYNLKVLTFFLAFFPLALIAQEDTDITEVYNTYKSLSSQKERLHYIDSIDSHRQFEVDPIYISLLDEILIESLESGDTSSVLGIFITLTNYHINNSFSKDTVLYYYERIQPYIERNKDNSQSAPILLNVANTYYYRGEVEASTFYYQEAAKSYEKTGGTSLSNYGDAHLYMADNLSQIGEFAKAIITIEKAQNIYLANQDTLNYLRARFSHAELLSSLELFTELKSTIDEVLKLAQEARARDIVFSIYGTYVYMYIDLGDYDQAVSYARKMLDLCGTFDENYYYLDALNAIISTYIEIDNLDSINYYFNIFEELNRIPGNNRIDFLNSMTLRAHVAFANGDINKTQSILNDYFHPYTELPLRYFQSSALDLQYSIDTSLGNYASAVKNLSLSKEIFDADNSMILKEQFAYYQNLFELNKQERILAEKKAQIARLEFKNNSERHTWTALLLFFSSAILVFFIRRKIKNSRERGITQEKYSRALLFEQEKERKRISREIHDGLGQSLVLVKNSVTLENMDMADMAISYALAEVQQLSRGLHPAILEELGLTKAIDQLLINALGERKEIKVETSIDNIDNILSPKDELNLYRIIQEAISNILKHSQADLIQIKIKRTTESIKILIKDNGNGFNIADQKNYSNSLGMRTMYERSKIIGGKLLLKSILNQSTTIDLLIPVR